MAGILADENSYSIKMAVFRGTNKTDLIKRNEYGYKCYTCSCETGAG